MTFKTRPLKQMLFKKDTELNECYRLERIFSRNYTLQKFYQNLVRNVRHCNKFAKFAILVQTCKILVRNAKLARISEEFCKICDSCNVGLYLSFQMLRRAFQMSVELITEASLKKLLYAF